MIWNEDALRTTWEAARRPEQECCRQGGGAVGIQHMAMARRFITEAFGRPADREFRYGLLTCAECRHGLGVVPDAPCGMRDLPWGPPHVNVPECVCEPLPNAEQPDAPKLALMMLMVHQ